MKTQTTMPFKRILCLRIRGLWLKTILTTVILVLALFSEAKAPGWRIEKIYVRLTAYSPKQIGEKSVNHKNKSIKDEIGVAVPKGLIPDGTQIRLPNGDVRIANDRLPYKSAKKYSGKVIDVRYYGSIRSKPKTRAVNKELARKFDMGKDWIEIYYPE